MFSTQRLVAVLSVAAMLAVFATGAEAARRDRGLHRPSTPRERAETRALNQNALAQAATPAPQQSAPRADRSQTQYQRELQAYRAAQRRYEQDMRAYNARDQRSRRDARRRGFRRNASAVPPRPGHVQTPEELDADPYAPTGGAADWRIAAPVSPNLVGATTGLPAFNARASGADQQRRRRR